MQEPAVENDFTREPVRCQKPSGNGADQSGGNVAAQPSGPVVLRFAKSLHQKSTIRIEPLAAVASLRCRDNLAGQQSGFYGGPNALSALRVRHASRVSDQQ